MKLNEFMNKLYSNSSTIVTGKRQGVEFLAYVKDVRVKYGTDLQATLVYDRDCLEDIQRDTDLIDGTELFNGGNGIFTDLKVEW